jgi:hypothetical protein
MASLNNYEGPSEIYVQGRLLAEAVKASFSVKANNNPVVTMRKGLAGKSDGARSSEGTIETAIPRAGYEYDFVEKVIGGAYIRVVVKSGGQRHTFDCWVESVDLSNATDTPAAKTITVMGGPPDSVGG